MVANRRLVELMNITEEDVQKINQLHEKIDSFMEDAIKGLFTERFVHETLRNWDFELQELWQFHIDESYHTLYKTYKFKKDWVGRTFKCTETGETFTIPFELRECDFFQFGNCFIDVGRHGFYNRFGGNMVEIGEKSDN